MKRLLVTMAAMLLSSLMAFGTESIVSVSRLDADTLQVNLSGIETERTLWLALDTADRGTDVAAWTKWCRISDLPAGSTLAFAKIPKVESVTGCRYLRCFLFEKGKLPGVETLESVTPSSAALDTGYTPGGRTKVVMDVKLGEQSQALFCSRGSDNLNRTYTLFMITANQMRYDYGSRSKYNNAFPQPGTVAAQTRYTFTMGPDGLVATNESGERKVSYTNPYPQEFDVPSHMFLFAAHSAGAQPFSAQFSGVFYGMKAWPEVTDESVLALDLVPAKKNGTVGIFDCAGGGFITPAAGSFTAGGSTAAAGTVCAVSPVVDVANYVRVESVDAAARTLTVRAQDVLSAGSLWVAYGTADAGDDICAWPHCAYVGEIASGASSQKVRLPQGWDKTQTHLRCFVLTADALPGATTLASVTPQSALVKTDFRPTGRTRVEIDVTLGSSAECIYCSRGANNFTGSYSLMHINGNQLRYDYDYKGRTQSSFEVIAGVKNAGRYDIWMLPLGLFAFTNGIQAAGNAFNKPNDYTATSDFYLFSAHNGGVNPNSPFGGVFFGCKVWREDMDDESLALDLVPAKKNGVVGLFNRTSGAFYAATSGSLTAGEEMTAPATQIALSDVHVCEACSITVLSQDNETRKLTLALSGVETDAELWIGTDTKNRGDDTLNWKNYIKVADIAQGTKSAEVTMPEGWGVSYGKLRCFLYSKDAIPGGERLAWLTASNAYVKVGYTPKGKTAIEMKARYDDCRDNHALFCARGSATDTRYALLVVGGGSNQLRYDYRADNASTTRVPPEHCNYDFLTDARGVSVDGILRPSQFAEKDFTAGGELYLFAYHTAGASPSGLAETSVSGVKIWSDYQDPDSLVKDIVPYRKGGVVGLYDLKAGQPLPDFVGGELKAGASCGDGVLAQSETVKYPKGLIILLRSQASAPARKVKLFMAGDSTLDPRTGGSNPEGYASWGSNLKPYLKDNVEIVNYARAGFSTADFMAADPVYGNVIRWDRIKNEAQAGDFVMIQFGHNDEKTLTVEQYKANLRTMVADVKAKGATPVLTTPIVRLTFENGVLVDNSFTPPLETYAEAMRAVAVETGAELAEMRELTRTAALKAGSAEALTWNVANDVTHPAEKGAKLYASLFYGYVKSSGLSFATIFR